MEATLLPASPPRPAPRRNVRRPLSRVVVPLHYSAWIRGDLGNAVLRSFQKALAGVPGLRLTRLIRGILVEADEEPGVLVEATLRAVRELEGVVQATYPALYHDIGPLWTGTLQSVFTDAPAPQEPSASGG